MVESDTKIHEKYLIKSTRQPLALLELIEEEFDI